MKKAGVAFIYLLLIPLILVACNASIGATSSHNTSPSDITPSSTSPVSTTPAMSDLEKLASDPGFKEHKFELKEANRIPRLNEYEAIRRAKEIIGTAYDNKHTTSINAIYALFTDNETPKLPGKGVLLKDLPVWIVTFDGLKIPSSGGRTHYNGPDLSQLHTQLHVVIDANTGEELEMFTYK
ncbi:MAG: hypothetical protein IBX64_06795 [Actinobacteria bacterium]|nr:hypothetical protein [Actinomycetota bacterium]